MKKLTDVSVAPGLLASTASVTFAGASKTLVAGDVNTSTGGEYPVTVTLLMAEVLSGRLNCTVSVLVPIAAGTVAANVLPAVVATADLLPSSTITLLSGGPSKVPVTATPPLIFTAVPPAGALITRAVGETTEMETGGEEVVEAPLLSVATTVST